MPLVLMLALSLVVPFKKVYQIDTRASTVALRAAATSHATLVPVVLVSSAPQRVSLAPAAERWPVTASGRLVMSPEYDLLAGDIAVDMGVTGEKSEAHAKLHVTSTTRNGKDYRLTGDLTDRSGTRKIELPVRFEVLETNRVVMTARLPLRDPAFTLDMRLVANAM